MATATTPNKEPLHPNGRTRIKPTAALIGVHHQTLRRWWKAGKFPKPTDINGILLFRNADILKWLAENQPDDDTDSTETDDNEVEGA